MNLADHEFQVINLIGRLTADPDLRATKDGNPVASLRIAVQRPRSKDGEDRGAEDIEHAREKLNVYLAERQAVKGRNQ
jgi:single-stranded DNA-binding protein